MVVINKFFSIIVFKLYASITFNKLFKWKIIILNKINNILSKRIFSK